jgi:YidC/Oxa1 family membrane protein insertase
LSDNRNMILAVILSLLVLLGWSWATETFFPSPEPAKPAVEAPAAGTPAAPPASPTDVAAPGPAAPAQLQSRAKVLASTPRVRIDTPSLRGSINLKGAQIDDLLLDTHRNHLDEEAPPVRLFSPLGAPNSQAASFGWVGPAGYVPTLDTVWTADSNVLAPGRPVTLTTQLPTGMRFAIRIAVDDGYLFTVRQMAANGTPGPVSIRPLGLISRSGKSGDLDSWTHHVGPIAVVDGTADYDVDFENLDEGAGEKLSGNSGWLGFTDKYWLAALAPNGPISADFRKGRNGGYQADYVLAPADLAPGQTATTDTRLFAGAKEKVWLDRYETAGIAKLSKSIDWGWFEWFMRPIFALLLALFKLTGNFGLAIIGLTLIVRIIMFPIANKQFQSMAAMRKLQPKMKAIQERFKDDKPRQQQEILKLYQAEKINPAAGCLPLLLQIPVFYALYKVLTVSVEMRHQPFVLWIKDLSAPDPLTPVNLFGLLDFTPPVILAIGVLPILVGFTQWLTMKLNPQPMDPVQAQIFAWMPWVLVIVMAPFAAGLQLYWMTNNVLSIAQQWWLYRRYGLHLSDTHPVET